MSAFADHTRRLADPRRGGAAGPLADAAVRAGTARWAAATGCLGILGAAALITMFALIAAGGSGDPFGPASDLLGSAYAATMIPVALVLRPGVWTTRLGIAAMTMAAVCGPALVCGLAPFAPESAVSVTAMLVVSLWLLVTCRRLQGRSLGHRVAAAGRLIAAVLLASAAGCAACLAFPFGSTGQLVALVIVGIPGALAWLAQPGWFLALAIDLGGSSSAVRRRRVPRLRRGAAYLHAALAALVIVAVFVQVYLIGAFIFGAGEGALSAHRATGFTANGLEVMVALAALLSGLRGTDLLLSVSLAIVGTVQISLAGAHRWVGALHPLFALVVLALAAQVVRRAVRRLRPPAQT